jgi:hypothetical protein
MTHTGAAETACIHKACSQGTCNIAAIPRARCKQCLLVNASCAHEQQQQQLAKGTYDHPAPCEHAGLTLPANQAQLYLESLWGVECPAIRASHLQNMTASTGLPGSLST